MTTWRKWFRTVNPRAIALTNRKDSSETCILIDHSHVPIFYRGPGSSAEANGSQVAAKTIANKE